MQSPSQEDELMKLRALLRRLQAQEAALTLALEEKPRPPPRPGWPIRRIMPAQLH